MRVLVTGGAGFLGSSLVEHLLDLDDEVVVLDNFWRGKPENLERILDKITLIESDASVASSYGLIKDPSSIDVVYHLAAVNGTKWFHEEARMVMDVNLNSTLRAIEFAEQYRCRFVFTSSPEAYGNSEVMPLGSLESSLFTHPSHHQRHAYGGSKYLGELAVQHAVRQGLDGRVVRPFNGYGPRLSQDEYGQVVAMFFQAILSQEPIQLHNGGLQTRSFTWIRDVVDGFLLAGLEDEGRQGESLKGRAFNIGSTEEVTIQELQERIFSIVEKDPAWDKDLPTVEVVDGYHGDAARRLPDCSEAEKLFTWRATTWLDQGLQQMWSALR